jgi:Flp pilus assembly protein TadD
MSSSKRLKAAVIAPFFLAVLQGCTTLQGGFGENSIWQTSTVQAPAVQTSTAQTATAQTASSNSKNKEGLPCGAMLRVCEARNASSKSDEELPGNGTARPGMEQAEKLLRLASDMQAHGGDRASWLSLYEQAVIASRNDAAYELRLAAAYNDAGRTADTLKTFRSVLAKDPSNGAALMGLGSTLIKTGALDKGIEAFENAAPQLNSPVAYTRLGVAYTQAGKVKEACTALERAHKLAPDDLDITTNLALASALASDYDKAVTLMREVTASSGVQPQHRHNLVLVLALAGQPDQAREAARQILKPGEIETLLSRAATIRGMSEPKARAKALGTISPSA